MLCVLDGVQKHFRAIEALTDLFWNFFFSMVLSEDGISLGLGSVNSATFLVWKIISPSGLFCGLDDVQKHFRAVRAPTDYFWKF